MFGLFSSKPNFTTKQGFLVPTETGPLIPATLVIYSNGVTIVMEDLHDNKYEVEWESAITYHVLNTNRYKKLILTE